MRLSQAINVAVVNCRAGIATLLLGPPGIGKTSIAPNIAEAAGTVKWTENGQQREGHRKVQIIRPLLMDAAEVAGVPYVDKETGVQKRAIPEWFYNCMVRPTLLVIDELTAALPAIQATLYEVLLDRTLNGHAMHPDSRVVATGNTTKDFAVAHNLSSAAKNRVMTIEMELPLSDWEIWAVQRGNIHSAVLGYLRHSPHHLNEFDVTDESSKKRRENLRTANSFATPRSWHMLSNFLHEDVALKDAEHEAFSGLVGKGIATTFLAHMKHYRELPDYMDIVSTPMKAKLPKDPSARYSVATMIGNRMTRKDVAPCMEYLERLDKEFQMIAVKDAYRRDPNILTAPAYQKWAMKNADFVL